MEDLERDFDPVDLVLVESGGDNLTATFSPALVDAQFFVLDVAGGGDVASKGGPGIARADVLIVNKTDLAPYVGVDVEQMVRDAEHARGGRTVIALSRTDPDSVARLRQWVLDDAGHVPRRARTSRPTPARWLRTSMPGTTCTATPTAQYTRTEGCCGSLPGMAGAGVSTATRIVVERSADRHRVTLGPGLLRGQLTRNTPGGCRIGLLATSALLLGGDEVVVEVVVGPGACLELFDVAGTVAYHGRGRPASWRVAIEIGAGASLVWAGQPFVVSDGADVTRVLEADLAPTARLALRETLVIGRAGQHGGRLLNRTALRVDGVPILVEDQLLDPAGIRDRPGMLGGHRVVDTVITVGDVPPGPAAATRYSLVGGRGALTRYLGRELADSPLR